MTGVNPHGRDSNVHFGVAVAGETPRTDVINAMRLQSMSGLDNRCSTVHLLECWSRVKLCYCVIVEHWIISWMYYQ